MVLNAPAYLWYELFIGSFSVRYGFFSMYKTNHPTRKRRIKTPTISFDLTYDVLRFVVVVVALLKVLLSIQALRRYAFAITF